MYYRKRDGKLQKVNPGTFHDNPISLKAGQEYTFEVYTRFHERDLLPHDWSYVIWTDKEPVTVDHVGFEEHGFEV